MRLTTKQNTPRLTENEMFKLGKLREVFTVELEYNPDSVNIVTLSQSYKFVAFTFDECFDKALTYILESGYRSDKEVKAEYEKGLKELFGECTVECTVDKRIDYSLES